MARLGAAFIVVRRPISLKHDVARFEDVESGRAHARLAFRSDALARVLADAPRRSAHRLLQATGCRKLSGAVTSERPTPAPSELRLALVGCGAIAGWHLRALRAAAARTRITAAIDVDVTKAEAMAREVGARAFTSLAAGLAADVFDAAFLMLPHHLHEQTAVAALDAGKHVLLEKPMAPTVAACQRILAAAERSGRILLIAENAQFWPEVTVARDLLTAGAIGEVITARAWHCSPPLGLFYGGERPWRLERASAGGGIAMDTGSHWLRPLRMWLGELTEVLAVTGRPYPAMEAESMCRALCRFESGVVASFDMLLVPGPSAPMPLFQITGTKGEIVIERSGRVMLYDGAAESGTLAGQGGYLRSYEGQAVDFERVVLDGAAPAAPAAYALGELRGALAMVRSAESRQWERVWDG